MDFLQVLRGETGSITQDQAGALMCAGLVSQWPDEVLRLGPIVQQALYNSSNDGAIISAGNCTSVGSALHEEAHKIAQAIQKPDTNHSLLTWWANALMKSSPSGIARKPLPALIDNRTTTTIANAGRSSRTTLALNLLGQKLEHLVLLDDASPEDGPAMWTMTYILAHENGLTGLPLEGREGLVARTTDYLTKSYEVSYLNALAVDGPFLVSESVDAQKHINLDFSGVGGAEPQLRGWNLSSTPGLLRGDECWFWNAGAFPDGRDSIDVPLSLSIHLAVLALRRAAAASTDKEPAAGNAVVVIGERKGWLYTQDINIRGLTSNPSDAWLEISDNGRLEYSSATRLKDLIENLPSATREAEAGLHAASALLGFRPTHELDIPDPKILRARIRLRDDQNLPLIQELFDYINTCARSL